MSHKLIQEGRINIKVPFFEKISSKAPVFYNPVMELNRDLSVAAITRFQMDRESEIKICDAFGGTGIRAIRYSKEIEGVCEVVTNDTNPLAVRLAKENIIMNNLNNVKVCMEEANILLRQRRGEFDVIDIDPFGTPSYHVESAAYSLKSSGMLCVTATDTSALCGTYKEPCIRKYGSMPLKTEYCHEIGIRILAGFLARTFAKYRKSVNLKFSHSTQHYMRIYITSDKGAKITDNSLGNLGYILHCSNCLNREIITGITPRLPLKCAICGEQYKVAGPLWCGKILDADFIKGMLNIASAIKINKKKKALKILETCYEESNAPATFYDLHKICKKLKISVPPLERVLKTLKNRGYFASRTHFKPTGIKTDAPLKKLKEMINDI